MSAPLVITGASGFLGRALVAAARAEGVPVRAVLRGDARELADGSDEGGRASTARSVDGGTAAAATAAAASTTASTHG